MNEKQNLQNYFDQLKEENSPDNPALWENAVDDAYKRFFWPLKTSDQILIDSSRWLECPLISERLKTSIRSLITLTDTHSILTKDFIDKASNVFVAHFAYDDDPNPERPRLSEYDIESYADAYSSTALTKSDINRIIKRIAGVGILTNNLWQIEAYLIKCLARPFDTKTHPPRSLDFKYEICRKLLKGAAPLLAIIAQELSYKLKVRYKFAEQQGRNPFIRRDLVIKALMNLLAGKHITGYAECKLLCDILRALPDRFGAEASDFVLNQINIGLLKKRLQRADEIDRPFIEVLGQVSITGKNLLGVLNALMRIPDLYKKYTNRVRSIENKEVDELLKSAQCGKPLNIVDLKRLNRCLLQCVYEEETIKSRGRYFDFEIKDLQKIVKRLAKIKNPVHSEDFNILPTGGIVRTKEGKMQPVEDLSKHVKFGTLKDRRPPENIQF